MEGFQRSAQLNRKRRSILLSLPHVDYTSQDILTRDKAVCVLCGIAVNPNKYDIEHIIPLQVDKALLSSYGIEHPGNVPWNVSVAHPACNSSKGNRMTQEDIARYLLWRYLYKE